MAFDEVRCDLLRDGHHGRGSRDTGARAASRPPSRSGSPVRRRRPRARRGRARLSSQSRRPWPKPQRRTARVRSSRMPTQNVARTAERYDRLLAPLLLAAQGACVVAVMWLRYTRDTDATLCPMARITCHLTANCHRSRCRAEDATSYEHARTARCPSCSPRGRCSTRSGRPSPRG